MTAPTFEGALGRAWALPIDYSRIDVPQQLATLASYLVHAPSAHPHWPQYVLYCVHLRDVDGQTDPPRRKYPDASHEIALWALNVPERGPFTFENVWPKLREGGCILSPVNAVEHLRGATDEEAVELTRLVARALVDGHLPAEPDDYRGARERWARTIANTLEHIRYGGHPGASGVQ